MGREGQAQDHSILPEIHLNFCEILLKTLSTSQALGAGHVLSLSYSLYYCCCFLLPYLYNETDHSFCDYCTSIQFKGSPSEPSFSPCQDLVCAPALWAVASFFFLSYKYLHTEGQDYFCS